MPCDFAFPAEIPTSCLFELFSRVRDGRFDGETLQIIAKILGNSAAIWASMSTPVFSSVEMPATIDGLMEVIENNMSVAEATGMDTVAAMEWRPNPDNVRMILELLLKLLPLIIR
jgi:hypothetical protein